METTINNQYLLELLNTAITSSKNDAETVSSFVALFNAKQATKHNELQIKLQELTTLAQRQAAEVKDAQEAARKLGEGLKKYKAAHSSLKKALEGVEE